ncbi:MAG: SDR family oxidoreductase [Acidisphaera sp.]|nr:SDR family oxidoreductase [Acidisphaera sp.]
MTDIPRSPLPCFSLADKRALVTGGGRGIGLAAALALAGYGAHVTLAARTADELEAAAARIRRDGGSADTLVLDVTQSAAVRTAIAARAPYDILLNNAGTNRPAPFLQVAEADYEAVMALNVRALFFTAQAVAAGLADAGRKGSIINISSQMGHVGAANRSVYCASKWAVEGLTKAMAVELAPVGIRVNALAPTFVETPMTQGFLARPAFREEVLSKIKLGRIGTVDDLTGAIVFLASDASSLMTGASIVIDGGWTAD